MKSFGAALDVAMPEYKSISTGKRSNGPLELVRESQDGRYEMWTIDETVAIDTGIYSALFKDAHLWDMMKDHHGVLVFQVDTLMLPSSEFTIYDYVKYDYVGAPWCEDNAVLKPMLADGTIKYLVGNGGYSWRTIRAMQECITEMGNKSPADEPEDRFFVRCFSADERKYEVAPVAVAQSFAIEVPCWNVEERVRQGKYPLALHAAWYYEDMALFRAMMPPSVADYCVQ